MRRRMTTTAALAVITGNLLVQHLLVRFLLVLHLLVRILLVLATPAGIELSNNFGRNRTQRKTNSALAARPCKLRNVRSTTTVARRPNDPPFDLLSTAAATR